MSRNDGHGAAPSGRWFCDAVELALVFVQCELVQYYMAAFASKSVWVGGEGINSPAVGELKRVGGDVVLPIKYNFAQIDRAGVEKADPVVAIFERELRLDVVACGDEDVKASARCANEGNAAVVGGIGAADLAGFLQYFQRGIVVDPLYLRANEIFRVGRRVHFLV